MKRVDLRELKDNFYEKMLEILKTLENEEVIIFLFEIGDFSHIQRVADFIYENEFTLMNSLKFNEKDWTVVIKNIKPEIKISKEEIANEKN
ncbi:putative NADH:quinone oxidoreductase I chain E (cl24924 superfamily) [Aliarcobacter faecis]|uniref:NADH-ubiquinone oxidoreductase subunit E family protein n=1 Tax=Aliarcobacter faecis TaxID=1564138 RepID=UPI00047C5489|nr:NADH-ubiquinone oxidoreductase subunit E family protein [Aliarcobacter faecis]QKF72332.1 putative NADH:quinone oxidoreductase I chain E (cl24924 superfamily) [Aliarcobacter faecis]